MDMDRLKAAKPKSVKVMRPLNNPFKPPLVQYGVTCIDPYKHSTIAWNWAQEQLAKEQNPAKAVVPFPGHVRYYH